MSFMTVDTRGNIIPKTPKAGYMAAHTYLMSTRPHPGDPRLALYQTAMAGIDVMGAAIVDRTGTSEPARSPRRYIEQRRSRSPRQVANTTRNMQGELDARYNAAQPRVNRAREDRTREPR